MTQKKAKNQAIVRDRGDGVKVNATGSIIDGAPTSTRKGLA